MTTNTDIVNRANKLSERLLEVESGCWEYVGGRTGAGYGYYCEGRAYQRGAHVVSYEIEKGPVPKGMFVLHSCDNPVCCRPDHLFLGTLQDNKNDEISKGRHVYGERVGNHKLTENEVRQIKFRLSNGDTEVEIAEDYKVTRQAIHYIDIGRNWAWVK